MSSQSAASAFLKSQPLLRICGDGKREMHTRPTLSVEEGAPYPKERKAGPCLRLSRPSGRRGRLGPFPQGREGNAVGFGEVRVGYFGAERNAALVLRHKILQSVILGKISVWSKNSGGGNLQKAK